MIHSKVAAEAERTAQTGRPIPAGAVAGEVEAIPAADLGERVDTIEQMCLLHDVAIDIRPEQQGGHYRIHFRTNHCGRFTEEKRHMDTDNTELKREVRRRIDLLAATRSLFDDVEAEGRPDSRINTHLKRAGQSLTDPRYETHLVQALGLINGWARTHEQGDIADEASRLLTELNGA